MEVANDLGSYVGFRVMEGFCKGFFLGYRVMEGFCKGFGESHRISSYGRVAKDLGATLWKGFG